MTTGVLPTLDCVRIEAVDRVEGARSPRRSARWGRQIEALAEWRLRLVAVEDIREGRYKWTMRASSLVAILFIGCNHDALPGGNPPSPDATATPDAAGIVDAAAMPDATAPFDATAIACTDFAAVSCAVAPCPAGQRSCCGACVPLDTDENCGGCGVHCAAGMVCRDGTCASSCYTDFTHCGDRCVNLANDPAHCGACGTVCPAGESCGGGHCGACKPPMFVCNGVCVDTSHDPNNCGSCGSACTNGFCQSGVCVCECTPPQTCCMVPSGPACGVFSSECIDLQSDPQHCGTCMTNICPAGHTCTFGVCS